MANRIKGITIEIDGNTTGLDKALQSINKSIRESQTALKDVDRLLKLNPSSTELLSQKQQYLGEAVAATRSKLIDEMDAMDSLNERAKKGEDVSAQQNALKREIEETTQSLKNLTKEYEGFGSVGAQQVAVVGEKLKGFGNGMADVGKQLTMKVTVPLVAVGTKAASSFAEVDKTMQLTNKTMGNTEEEAKMLDQAMKDAAANSTFGMTDAATATLNFARAGLSATEAADALAPAMNLAAGEGGNLDTVSAGLVATINGFGGSFDEAAQYADVFANACNNSALDIDSLASSMSVAAPVFAAAGYNVNDAALYMGVMANSGIEASVAANALKTGFARLVDPSKDAQEALDKLNWSVLDENGAMKDSITIQAELHDKFAELSEAEQIEAASSIFGKNQMANWLALINTAPGEVSALSASLQEEGTTAEMAEAMMSGFGGSLEKLKSSVDVAATSLGEALAPMILKVSEAIQKAVDWFNSLSDEQKEMIAKIGLLVAAIGPLLLIVGKGIVLIGQILTYAPAISGAFAALTGPVGLAVAAVAGLIAIGVALGTHWDEVVAWTKNLAKSIADGFNKILNSVKTAVTNTWNAVKSAFQNIVNAITNAVNTARNTVSNVFNAIRSTISSVLNGVYSTVSSIFNNVKNTISNVLNSALNVVRNIVDGIKGAFNFSLSIPNIATGALDAARGAVDSVVGWIKGAFNFGLSLPSVATGVFSSVTSTVQGIVDRVKGAFNFSWSLPTLRVPHVSVDGGAAPWGIGGKGRLPSFHVTWHKDAYNNPLLFTSPTVLATPNGLHGFGDGNGGELVIGVDKLREVLGTTGNRISVNVYASPGMDETALANKVAAKLDHWLGKRL